jgi:ADP-ribose pyrophosphatase YjhB (NUDIX family)
MSDYVRELRALIGNRQLLLPSVSILVWDAAGRLLMVRNIETGLWQTVGGAVEPAEDPREAALREAVEETGLAIALTGIRGVTGGPEFQFTYPNGHQVAFAGIIFDAVATGGELLSDGDGDEVSAARWWPVAELETAAMSELTRALLIRAGVFGSD